MINHVEIASKSKPSEVHIVNRDQRGLVCSCPSFQFRRYCTHCRDAAPIFAAAAQKSAYSSDQSKILAAQAVRLQALADKVAGLSPDAKTAEKIFVAIDAIEKALVSASSMFGRMTGGAQ